MKSGADTLNLAAEIRASEQTRTPAETPLSTDQKVLASITNGIYRQPSSALRELISNAYDADAKEVVILTDAPRFAEISVRDDGNGLSPEVLEHVVRHIGGSSKRSGEGQELGVTDRKDQTRSPGGRRFIGRLGIGLFSVAQFTRHFLIITKTAGDKYRTVADITLGPVGGQQKEQAKLKTIQTGHAKIWREAATDPKSHGTEIKLLELLPRTKAELASDDLWTRLRFASEDADEVHPEEPAWHIGQMTPRQREVLERQPQLPWTEKDSPKERFIKLVQTVRETSSTLNEVVDLDKIFDRYLQTMWTLSLAAPLDYVEGHPFDFRSDEEVHFFTLDNKPKGQAKELKLTGDQTPRKVLGLIAPKEIVGDKFTVTMDGVQLYRPIIYRNLPKTETAMQTPLVFIGHEEQRFEKKPIEMSGGPLSFEAYLFWAPRVVPKQHQGVILRVGNASGALFDKTFMGYQVSEQTRTRQIIAEVFVTEGLDGAINIDRESFNYAHPHYQYLVKWLHSALRQLANKHKELGSAVRSKKLKVNAGETRARVDEFVEKSLKSRGIADVPTVTLVNQASDSEMRKLRSGGTIAFKREKIVPPSDADRQTPKEQERQKIADRKTIAILKILHSWGLLEALSYKDQEKLMREIMEIVLMDTGL